MDMYPFVLRVFFFNGVCGLLFGYVSTPACFWDVLLFGGGVLVGHIYRYDTRG